MHIALKKYDDFVIASGNLAQVPGFTLSALVHNEMHFLAPFLEHYRRLGVARFVFVDDRSTDGTSAFLAVQNDVVVLRSQRKYGDKIDAADAAALGLPHQRLELVWRMLLLEKFGLNRWSLHLDADEFLELPQGQTISELASTLDEDDGAAVWAAMIDMYPATVTDLVGMAQDEIIDLNKSWYFDGQPHLGLRHAKPPRTLHPGSRARLLHKFGLNRKVSGTEHRVRQLFRLPIPRYNAIRKPALLRWQSGHRFDSAHKVNLTASPRVLLPLRHYKFNGPIHQRIQRASTTGGNTGGGVEYKDLAGLITAMSENDEDFRYARSIRHQGFDDFQRSGNAVGFR